MPVLPGTRPWMEGQVLVSTGTPSLDKILGGGLPVGDVCLLEMDEGGAHAAAISGAFVAVGVAAGHEVAVVGRSESVLRSLACRIPRPISEAEESDDIVEHTKLEGAHQYERYVKDGKEVSGSMEEAGKSVFSPRTLGKSPYCVSLDLSRSLLDGRNPLEEGGDGGAVFLTRDSGMALRAIDASLGGGIAPSSARLRWYKQGKEKEVVSNLVARCGEECAGRLLVWCPSEQVGRLIRLIKSVVKGSNVCVMVCADSRSVGVVGISRARGASSSVLSIQAFGSNPGEGGIPRAVPAELASAVGLLNIRKPPASRAFLAGGPASRAVAWAIKRDRRKLKVEPAHLAPADAHDAAGITATNTMDQSAHRKQTHAKDLERRAQAAPVHRSVEAAPEWAAEIARTSNTGTSSIASRMRSLDF